MTTNKKKSAASIRQDAYLERRLKNGWKKKVVWIKPKHEKVLSAFVNGLNSEDE